MDDCAAVWHARPEWVVVSVVEVVVRVLAHTKTVRVLCVRRHEHQAAVVVCVVVRAAWGRAPAFVLQVLADLVDGHSVGRVVVAGLCVVRLVFHCSRGVVDFLAGRSELVAVGSGEFADALFQFELLAEGGGLGVDVVRPG